MKKFISMVLIFVLLFSVTSFAEKIPSEFEDVKKYEIMKIDSNEDLLNEELLTRAEMVEIVVNATGFSGAEAENVLNEGFSDVDDKHWAYNSIVVAQAMGLINGNGRGMFIPDDNVTYEQAIKMIVILLGYEPIALQKGGYPSGYIETAEQIGLTEDIKFESADNVLKYDAAVLMQKALNTPIMEQISYGKVAEYAVSDGKDGRDFVTLKDILEKLKSDSYN